MCMLWVKKERLFLKDRTYGEHQPELDTFRQEQKVGKMDFCKIKEDH